MADSSAGVCETNCVSDVSEVDSANTESLSSRDVRRVYLITYSQANLEIVPTREAFARIILDAFDNAVPESNATVIHWVCSQESHADGGLHYHMAVKLSGRRRWLPVRNYIDQEYGVQVNFSDRHDNYYSAWTYTTKEDSSSLQSTNHPDLRNDGAPITTNASCALRERRLGEGDEDTSNKKGKRKRSLSIFDVSQIAVDRRMKTRLELVALASQQKREGKTDLAQFIANRGSKAVEEALSIGWEMENAESELARSKLSRVEIVYRELESPCVDGCQGKWLEMAEQVLQRNGISRDEFSEAVRNLLQQGRGKYRNVFLKGPANCGKTFLLNPLNTVFKTFTNPATTTFAWLGAQTAEVIFLNDFRWCSQIIPWHDLLLLLEGQKVHLPAPKTHFSEDIEFTRDTPIFCTSKEELTFVRGGVLDERESHMMRDRWKVFALQSPIPEEEQRITPNCPHCFAKLIFPQV